MRKPLVLSRHRLRLLIAPVAMQQLAASAARALDALVARRAAVLAELSAAICVMQAWMVAVRRQRTCQAARRTVSASGRVAEHVDYLVLLVHYGTLNSLNKVFFSRFHSQSCDEVRANLFDHGIGKSLEHHNNA